MAVSGYQILDLKNIEIDSSTGATIAGVYDIIEGATKPILVCGINNDGVEAKPRFIAFDVDSTDFVGIFGDGYNMVVTSADKVTIEAWS